MDRENNQNVDNVDDEDFRPAKPKKQRKTLPKRFGSISDGSAIEVMKKGYVPENTKKSTSWAVGVFSEWRATGIQHPVKRFVQQIYLKRRREMN